MLMYTTRQAVIFHPESSQVMSSLEANYHSIVSDDAQKINSLKANANLQDLLT